MPKFEDISFLVGLTKMELELVRNNLPIVIAAPILLVGLMAFCCIPERDDVGANNRRNAKLASLLTMMLIDQPNDKYLEIAKDIGIDHIVPDERVFSKEITSDMFQSDTEESDDDDD